MLRSEIAEVTGISIRIINKEIDNGNLIAYEDSGKVLIRFHDFLTWIVLKWEEGIVSMKPPEYILRYMYTFGMVDKCLERLEKYNLL